MARWATLPRPDSFPAIRVALRTGRVADRAANRHSGCPRGNGRADAEHQPGSDPPSELGSFCWRSSRHSRVDAAGITAAGGTGLTQKVREGGRIVNVCVVVVTGVNAEGQREILGMDVGASEDGAFWLAVLRSLTARGLSGVELATSDAHQGLKNAIAAVFTGASWQRCRTHFMANLLTRVPKRALLSLSKGRRGHPGPSRMVRTIYQQLSPAEVHGQLDRVVEQLREPFAQVAELLADAAPDILAARPSQWPTGRSCGPTTRRNG